MPFPNPHRLSQPYSHSSDRRCQMSRLSNRVELSVVIDLYISTQFLSNLQVAMRLDSDHDLMVDRCSTAPLQLRDDRGNPFDVYELVVLLDISQNEKPIEWKNKVFLVHELISHSTDQRYTVCELHRSIYRPPHRKVPLPPV